MKYKQNYGASDKDIKKGHCNDESGGDKMDDGPPNKWVHHGILYDEGDGGFAGRPKGSER